MKKFAALALILALVAPAAFAAEQGEKPAAPVPSYVLRVAMDAGKPASCPTGFSLVKDQKMTPLANGRLQVFDCAKD